MALGHFAGGLMVAPETESWLGLTNIYQRDGQKWFRQKPSLFIHTKFVRKTS